MSMTCINADKAATLFACFDLVVVAIMVYLR